MEARSSPRVATSPARTRAPVRRTPRSHERNGRARAPSARPRDGRATLRGHHPILHGIEMPPWPTVDRDLRGASLREETVQTLRQSQSSIGMVCISHVCRRSNFPPKGTVTPCSFQAGQTSGHRKNDGCAPRVCVRTRLSHMMCGSALRVRCPRTGHGCMRVPFWVWTYGEVECSCGNLLCTEARK